MNTATLEVPDEVPMCLINKTKKRVYGGVKVSFHAHLASGPGGDE